LVAAFLVLVDRVYSSRGRFYSPRLEFLGAGTHLLLGQHISSWLGQFLAVGGPRSLAGRILELLGPSSLAGGQVLGYWRPIFLLGAEFYLLETFLFEEDRFWCVLSHIFRGSWSELYCVLSLANRSVPY
jgi:hypothetical protein